MMLNDFCVACKLKDCTICMIPMGYLYDMNILHPDHSAGNIVIAQDLIQLDMLHCSVRVKSVNCISILREIILCGHRTQLIVQRRIRCSHVTQYQAAVRRGAFSLDSGRRSTSAQKN
ncbi:hypothetical protein M5K25_011443 [Dendrobium thyrsiflorum]|uniref:Uncharacterized protein n=1 Tax=Dendrobium thyrsiflorum TaxID=117978 RepID=A0ABD0V3H5_DENTH